MAYTAWSVVYGEQPTAAKWNQLGSNDAGFKDGTNIDNDAIINRHMADDSVTPDNLNLDATADSVLGANFATSSTSFVDSGLKVTLPAAGIWLVVAEVRSLSASSGQFGVVQLYNQTTAAAITDTEKLSAYAAGANERTNTTILARITTATINNIIRVNVKSAGAYTHTVESDLYGKSRMFAIRIG